MSLRQGPRAAPDVVLFDWHATLVDTHDAMYHAVDDVIPRLMEMGLIDRLTTPQRSRNLEDAKLVKYTCEHGRLHPKVRNDRRISRTDIFEVLFGDDAEAKRLAHAEFDQQYAAYVGQCHALDPDTPAHLDTLRDLGCRLGVISNRRRDFMTHELALVDGGRWQSRFDTLVCGDDVRRRKPAPDLILRALDDLDVTPSTRCWYVGDSTTDVYAAKTAGVSAIFFNGVGWDQTWIDKIFPATARHPHRPDTVVATLAEMVAMAQRYRQYDCARQ